MKPHRLGAATLLCLSLMPVGCATEGEGDAAQQQGTKAGPGTERLAGCLRDSGATVKEVAPPGHPGAEDKRLHAIFGSGYAGVFLIYRSSSPADRRYQEHRRGQAAPVLRKGGIILSYSGHSVDATTKSEVTTLEDCLRQSGPGDDPPRGELARQLSQIEARKDARRREYRDRQYNAPDEIRRELARLRSYRRYTLYHLGERHASHALTGLNSKLQPVIYGRYTKPRLPKPSSPTFDFIYGDCKPPPGREGGCRLPLTVRNYEICALNPNSYRISARTLTERIRGVPYYMRGAGALELYTGTTTVVIFANDSQAAKRAAQQLRSIDGRIGPRRSLPAPVGGALEGRLRCRPAPKQD